MLRKKNESLIKLLNTYDDIFREEICELVQWREKLNTNTVKTSIKNANKYAEFLDYSEEMNNLMKIPLWNSQAIRKMTDLLVMRNRTIDGFNKLILSFDKRDLTLS